MRSAAYGAAGWNEDDGGGLGEAGRERPEDFHAAAARQLLGIAVGCWLFALAGGVAALFCWGLGEFHNGIYPVLRPTWQNPGPKSVLEAILAIGLAAAIFLPPLGIGFSIAGARASERARSAARARRSKRRSRS
jgi:hypothetical protein